MKSKALIAVMLTAASFGLAASAGAQTAQDDTRFRAANDRFSREMTLFQQEFDRYQQTRRGGYRGGSYDRGSGYADERYEPDYDATRYYRSGDAYQERVLASDDRVYRGSDGRYYCKRNDGTTGLIVGAGAGGILGNVIDGGRSRTVGTLLGVAAGALAGRAIEQSSSQNQVRCR